MSFPADNAVNKSLARANNARKPHIFRSNGEWWYMAPRSRGRPLPDERAARFCMRLV